MAKKLNIDVAIKMIPEFDGNRVNLHRFITCCDIVDEELCPETDEGLLLNIIKTKLTGSAYNNTKHKTFANWLELKNILAENFSDKRTIPQVQSELLNVRQLPNEDVRAYANRVEKLLFELNDVCIESEGEVAKASIENLNSKSALRGFVEGLNSSIRLIVKASRFKTLTEAIDGAVDEERNVNAQKSKFNSKSYSKPFLKCSFCHKSGHKYENCFSRNNNLQVLPKFSKHEIKSESKIFKINITCSYCKKEGHHIRDCYKRKYNENKKFNDTSHNANTTNPTPSTSQQTYDNSGNARGPGPHRSSETRIRTVKEAAEN